jgi:hypothetical protein
MPRADRITCAGCEKQIDRGSLNACSNNLFRLFLSARSLKRVTFTDFACRKCRYKFDNWMKKTRDDFQNFVRTNDAEKVTVRFSMNFDVECDYVVLGWRSQ